MIDRLSDAQKRASASEAEIVLPCRVTRSKATRTFGDQMPSTSSIRFGRADTEVTERVVVCYFDAVKPSKTRPMIHRTADLPGARNQIDNRKRGGNRGTASSTLQGPPLFRQLPKVELSRKFQLVRDDISSTKLSTSVVRQDICVQLICWNRGDLLTKLSLMQSVCLNHNETQLD